MITEDYVSVETAKLLKEKKFNETCTHVYNIETGRNLEADFYTCRYVYNSWLDKNEPRFIVAPTLQMAMKWLRKEHNIQIVVSPYNTLDKTWSYHTFRNFEALTQRFYAFETYEEAAEAAIKYCLENLI